MEANNCIKQSFPAAKLRYNYVIVYRYTMESARLIRRLYNPELSHFNLSNPINFVRVKHIL